MLDFACFSRDKIVPLHRKEKSTTRDVGLEAFLILFSCDFVPFLSRLGFVSRNKISQVVGLQRVANGEKCKNALTTSNHQKHPIFILSLFATLGMSKSQPKRLLTESSQSGNGQDRNASLHKYSLQTAYMRKNIAYMPFFLMRIKNHSAERKKSFSAD